MKMTLLLSLLFTSSFFLNNTFASGELNKALEKKEVNQSSEKKSRRKKVQICHECGKPETECDCEGEEHGTHHDTHED